VPGTGGDGDRDTDGQAYRTPGIAVVEDQNVFPRQPAHRLFQKRLRRSAA
jgi:hypothetical protein